MLKFHPLLAVSDSRKKHGKILNDSLYWNYSSPSFANSEGTALLSKSVHEKRNELGEVANMASEDAASRAYERMQSKEDTMSYLVCASRWGPLQSKLFCSSEFPGNFYNALANSSARTIQRCWHRARGISTHKPQHPTPAYGIQNKESPPELDNNDLVSVPSTLGIVPSAGQPCASLAPSEIDKESDAAASRSTRHKLHEESLFWGFPIFHKSDTADLALLEASAKRRENALKEQKLMLAEDAQSRASEMRARKSDDDIFLECSKRWGAQDGVMYAQSDYPGKDYKNIADEKAKRLQRWWHSAWVIRALRKEEAAKFIQRLQRGKQGRLAVAKEKKAKAFLSKLLMRKQLKCLAAWRRYTTRERRLRAFYCMRMRRLQSSVFKSWVQHLKERLRYYESVLSAHGPVQRHRRKAKSFHHWRRSLWRLKEVRRRFAACCMESKQRSFMVWNEHIKVCRAARLVQRVYRGWKIRTFVMNIKNAVSFSMDHAAYPDWDVSSTPRVDTASDDDGYSDNGAEDDRIKEVGSAIEDAAGSQAGKSAADDSDDLAEGDPVKTSAAFALSILASFEDGKETLVAVNAAFEAALAFDANKRDAKVLLALARVHEYHSSFKDAARVYALLINMQPAGMGVILFRAAGTMRRLEMRKECRAYLVYAIEASHPEYDAWEMYATLGFSLAAISQGGDRTSVALEAFEMAFRMLDEGKKKKRGRAAAAMRQTYHTFKAWFADAANSWAAVLAEKLQASGDLAFALDVAKFCLYHRPDDLNLTEKLKTALATDDSKTINNF